MTNENKEKNIMEKTMKVYKIGDHNYVMAHSSEDAMQELKSHTDVEDDWEIRELTEKEMEALTFVEDPSDEESPSRSFSEELQRRVDAGDGQDMFAISED